MLMNKCKCRKSYCSIIKTGKKHYYMLYLDFSNITVLSQKFSNSALVWFNPIRSGIFLTANDPGGGGVGAFKPPPLRSRKLLCQSLPYHTCAFYQVL